MGMWFICHRPLPRRPFSPGFRRATWLAARTIMTALQAKMLANFKEHQNASYTLDGIAES